jgi:hypothetical protein
LAHSGKAVKRSHSARGLVFVGSFKDASGLPRCICAPGVPEYRTDMNERPAVGLKINRNENRFDPAVSCCNENVRFLRLAGEC